MPGERPAKRIRQACEPCRRKKSRCPGEKPTCSHCTRLRQSCYYAEEPHRRSTVPEAPQLARTEAQPAAATTDSRLEDRLKFVEAKLLEVLSNQSVTTTPRIPPRQVSFSPATTAAAIADPPQGTSSPSSTKRPLLPTSSLPPWDMKIWAAQKYLLYCDCQPLALFHRDSFIATLGDRDSEVMFAILALTIRFSEDSPFYGDCGELAAGYAEAARVIVMQSVSQGTVELSTLQSLCLLSLIDFSNGNTQRASVHSGLAMSLAHNAGLTSESPLYLTDKVREERRRCFWSLFLLKRLHGADFSVLDFSGEENFPWYPETTGKPVNSARAADRPSPPRLDTDPPREHMQDKGVVAYAIQLSEVWFKTTRYSRRRGKPSSLPPWSPQSEYSIILAQQMDFETRMPYIHRFKPAEFSKKSAEDLHANRDYWGPWLFIQFLYHTNLCLLNHPLLLSLRLRNFKCVIPEIFLQHTADLIASHASWILHFIDMLQAKSFKVTDPFLAHCVAIVATIYLQESFSEDFKIRDEKQAAFTKCLKFVRDFGQQWPHVDRMADKLQRLGETVSSTCSTSSDSPQRPTRSLLIDLGQFWEILEYSSSSEIPSKSSILFGPSLYSGVRRHTAEMAHTSALPEPTRVDRQDFDGTGPQNTPAAGVTPAHEPRDSSGAIPAESGVTPLMFSNDELAVLTESFFHQRNNDFEGGVNVSGVEDWWNSGNL
ncbi:hypothetical protein BP6252_02083 [Coleophoma cylindrospora]|uniref:Zn(2)-C6 fungal-type domain-containing protein n=1 Tax=Coleophoma cylindrospora TaxID=1849047 RepID=A0A3D8SDV1_9HELO|nr:hypothetical protein BP6252_02083 [Coleophoma cylindrospora]